MYRYDTTFAFPVRGVPQTYKAYDAELLIRNDADGKSYLYDLLDIEKKKVISAAPFSAETHSEVFAPKPSTNNISTSGEKVNGKFSLKGMDSAYLAAVERGDTEAAQKTKTAAREGDGEGRFSIKRTSQMTLAQQLKMYYDGKMASSDAFYFGETPDTLASVGLDSLPLAFTISDFHKSAKGKHNVPRRVWKNLNSSLENALFAFRIGDRVGIMTSDIDGDGKPLLVGIERNVSMDREPVNAIRSVYGLDNPGAWLRNQFTGGKEYIPLNKEKANAFLQTYGAYSASVGDGIRSTDAIVEDSQSDVKGKFSLKGMDSAGRQLL